MFTNYNILLNLKILKSVSDVFMNNFLILYFLSESNDNILQIGIYYLIMFFVLYLVIYFVKDKCKSKRRILLLRLSVIFNFIFFAALLLLGSNVINYIWLIAIIYGLAEGCYFSVVNNFESTGVSNTERANFLGVYTSINAIIGVSIPIVFGYLMGIDGFFYCLIIMLIISVTQTFWSLKFKDKFYKEEDRCDMKAFKLLTKDNRVIKRLNIAVFFQGIIYSGAFNSVVVIYIIRTLNDSLSFGIFTAVFAFVTSVVGWYFAKKIKSKDYEKHLKIAVCLTLTCLGLVIVNCNLVTIIIFNLIQSYSKTIIELINEVAKISISNIPELKEKYKIEYFVIMEKFMFYGRLFSYSLFILMGLLDTVFWTNVILLIFGVLILGYYIVSIKLNRQIVWRKVYE